MPPLISDRLPDRFDDYDCIAEAIRVLKAGGFDRRTAEAVLVRRAPVDLDILAHACDEAFGRAA
ncbi:hypothetical protein [Aurantimonas sp. Leaf443]|uniref:hypothetical protein n=1 Tax=Aurantimonas sp. Leaf443 TaxID=1736378 RepID=UPI0012E36FA7|nr:hypothetical protein [Aurantimonas sp. Leaf443]